MNENNLFAVIGSTQRNAMIGKGNICPTLTEAMGMGGGQIPMIVIEQGGKVKHGTNDVVGFNKAPIQS
jgi:hypothetical protein